MTTQTRPRLGYAIALLLVAVPPLFLNLGRLPVRLWDESRQAVSALEMLDGGDPLVPTYLGKPDMWNTKPPLLVWLQVASLRVLGLNEFAIRLPSAMAALATVILLFAFCTKALGNPRLGFLAGLVLISSRGYVGPHAARTGDYDALLTLWTTSCTLSFFLVLETASPRHRPWYLLLSAVCMGLAVLTKSVSGLLILPGLLLYAVIRGRRGTLLRSPVALPGLALFLAMTGGYYLLREHHNPGYLAAVLKNDVGGRFFSTIEQHKGPFDYYYSRLRDTRFSPWLYFLPLGLGIGVMSSRPSLRHLSVCLTITFVSFFLIISTGQTKLEWYDVPMYPLAGLIVAAGIDTIMSLLLRSRGNTNSAYGTLAAVLLGFALFAQPYRTVFLSAWSPREERWEEEKYHLAHFLQSELRHGPTYAKLTVVYQGYDQHLRFYAEALRRKGCAVSFVEPSLLPNSVLAAASQLPIKAQIESLYDHEVMLDAEETTVYLIAHRQDQEQ